MESTKLCNMNHHFLEPALNIQHNDQNDQSTSSFSDIRRNETDSCNPVFGESSTAALARHVSVSRSGRYKSKSKQRASLLANGIDFSSAAVVFFADDILTSPSVVNPPTVKSVDERRQPVEQLEISSAQTDVETRKTDASTVEETATTSVSSSTEESPKPAIENRSPAPPDNVDVCLELAVAEMDESTDL